MYRYDSTPFYIIIYTFKTIKTHIPVVRVSWSFHFLSTLHIIIILLYTRPYYTRPNIIYYVRYYYNDPAEHGVNFVPARLSLAAI